MPYKDPDKRREYHREYGRKWVAARKEQQLQYQREYRRKRYAVDPEWRARLQAHSRKGYMNHGTKRNEQRRLRRRTDAVFRKIEQQRERSFTYRRRLRAIEFLGGACSRCGNGDVRVLEIDHVKGDGNLDRRIGRDQGVACTELAKGIAPQGKYQLLCANCHCIKHWEVRTSSSIFDPSQ